MSDQLLEEYKAYYRARSQRYADNPKYQNSYNAERALYEAMDSCNELAEFRDKLGNLNELCAVALIKDEHQIERDFYREHKETVRILMSQRVLERVEGCDNVMDAMNAVQEESSKNSLEISMDEWQREFQYDWKQLDDIEIFRNAEVPDAYKARMQETADDIQNRLLKSISDGEEEARKFQPDFTFKPELNLEHRHRRLIPYKDEHVQEQVNRYKTMINR